MLLIILKNIIWYLPFIISKILFREIKRNKQNNYFITASSLK